MPNEVSTGKKFQIIADSKQIFRELNEVLGNMTTGNLTVSRIKNSNLEITPTKHITEVVNCYFINIRMNSALA